VPYQLADELHRSLPEDREEKTIFLDALRRVLEKMEVVTVMVAFHPTENFMKELLEKIREVLTLNVVVRIVVSRLLLGGARVEYKGRIVDLSIRSKLTKILEEHQSELGDWGVGN
jgi:F0F1-type ATP synthase delta subunit